MSTLGFLILAIVGLFVFMQAFVIISGFLKKGKAVTEFGGDLGRRVKRGEKLLLYFYSPGCSACRPMTPVIDQMKKENNNVYKLNVSKNSEMEISRIFGVMGTPATVVVENNKIQKYVLGARSESFLKKLI